MIVVPAALQASPRRSSDPLQVYAGNARVSFGKAQPLRKGQLILIPLRPVVEALGGKVVDGPNRRTFITLGERRVDLSLSGGRSWVNGLPRYLKDAPWISQGEVIVPVGFFTNALGLITAANPRQSFVRIAPQSGPNPSKTRTEP